MTSYSRTYYEAYIVATGKAVSAPTSYDAARAIADGIGECGVRFHHADRLTARRDALSALYCSACGRRDLLTFASGNEFFCCNRRMRKIRCEQPDFFDDEISRAIRTTEVVPALVKPDLHNEVAEEGCDRCVCGCKYWEHDRCIDCGAHVSEIRAEQARLDALGPPREREDER